MSAPIGPGDYVECVDASPGRRSGARLVLGAIYRVQGIVCGEGPQWPGILLDKPFASLSPHGWSHRRFRPIYTPRADLINKLKQPAPDAVRELIAAD